MTTQTVGPEAPAAPGPGTGAQDGLGIPTGRRLLPFLSLLARDLRVIRRDLLGFVLRSTTQPLLFVFVFAYVMPKTAGAGGAAADPGGLSFSTVLVPGMVASAVMMQGIMSVSTPLVMELSYTREIEDRVLAPLPLWMLGLSKILVGALQGCVAGLMVLPCVLFVHAPGQAPHISTAHWPQALGVLVLAALLMAGVGLLIGTIVEPRKLSALFTVVMVPITMLGCVYYPWASLRGVGWLQWAILVNPLVYVSEALRAAFDPTMPHLPVWAFMSALTFGTALVCAAAVRTLQRRLSD
ncbi:ABC transporter permease [Streptacidiphilus sp. P02-A3a]|uniref:ABC transporter permease n=1 Tax=Streptacidiphilus sp. P02-A3a TaxID=2704468 RepID=UPI0015F98DEF|nr:ABC transporter permease [Streptacidiphilus sp. P02-A3a]QMU73246.1 ABC transporter permease [Streptacidiphilus sp. P02-A3a]